MYLKLKKKKTNCFYCNKRGNFCRTGAGQLLRGAGGRHAGPKIRPEKQGRVERLFEHSGHDTHGNFLIINRDNAEIF